MPLSTKVTLVVSGALITLFGGYVMVGGVVGAFEGIVAALIGGLLVGGMFLAIGLFILNGSVRGWSTFLAIGSRGINWHVGEDRWIEWHEIDEVGISVIQGAKGGKVVRIRIAGTVPGLPQRPDLDRWRTNDEPEPYTHKVLPPAAILSGPDGSLVAAALERYAGRRYTGIDERRTFTRRYS